MCAATDRSLAIASSLGEVLSSGGPADVRRRLDADAIHVWAQRLDLEPSDVDALRGLLAPDEVARADRFRFAPDRRRFTVARATLRVLLGRYAGLPPDAVSFEYRCVCGEPHCSTHRRKPALANAPESFPLHFNLSHSGTLALVAFATTEVGVDVERVRPDIDWRALSMESFTVADATAIGRLSDTAGVEAFYACWTRKEALLKAMGRGLAAPPQSQPTFHAAPDGTARRSWTYDGPSYGFLALSNLPAGHIGSLVVADATAVDTVRVEPCDVRRLWSPPVPRTTDVHLGIEDRHV